MTATLSHKDYSAQEDMLTLAGLKLVYFSYLHPYMNYSSMTAI